MVRKSMRLLVGLMGIAILTGCSQVESMPQATTAPQALTAETPSSPTTTPTPQWTPVPISPTQVIHKDSPTTPAILTPANPAWQEQIAQAKHDLAQRLSIDVDQIELVEVQTVVWPDGSLGCPQPGMAYIQVQQDGLLIHLRVGKHTYNYHSGGNRGPFLCEDFPGGDSPLPPPGSGSK